ncbi:hypothetical protein K7X08_012926 [Anisodus acutangulus]|uniref:Uncharacterized protein n=1 Tax=Anisodus acutangulus TaxID=402998 RepID=A0A9Q1MBZ6_9SOLA|nr:hypothetical protein K7X08_012926 [Anisodus acutangulus]
MDGHLSKTKEKRKGPALALISPKFGGDSLLHPLRKAYDEVFGAFHGVNTKNAIYATMEELVHKTEFFNLIDNNEDAVRKLMKRYISASACVCQHIEQLYRSTEDGEELLTMI